MQFSPLQIFNRLRTTLNNKLSYRIFYFYLFEMCLHKTLFDFDFYKRQINTFALTLLKPMGKWHQMNSKFTRTRWCQWSTRIQKDEGKGHETMEPKWSAHRNCATLFCVCSFSCCHSRFERTYQLVRVPNVKYERWTQRKATNAPAFQIWIFVRCVCFVCARAIFGTFHSFISLRLRRCRIESHSRCNVSCLRALANALFATRNHSNGVGDVVRTGSDRTRTYSIATSLLVTSNAQHFLQLLIVSPFESNSTTSGYLWTMSILLRIDVVFGLKEASVLISLHKYHWRDQRKNRKENIQEWMKLLEVTARSLSCSQRKQLCETQWKLILITADRNNLSR